MYGDIIQFRKNGFMVEGKIPSSIMKEPDIANSIIYKESDIVYVIDTGATTFFGEKLIEAIEKLRHLILADETFEFFNCWPDSDSDNVKAVLNNSIQLFKSKEAEILISGHTHTVMKNEEAVRFLEILKHSFPTKEKNGTLGGAFPMQKLLNPPNP